jgi:AICAR transformylase/IMP cyclohydrolase PurH
MHQQIKAWGDSKVEMEEKHLVQQERFNYGSNFKKLAAQMPRQQHESFLSQYHLMQGKHGVSNFDDDEDFLLMDKN